MNHIKRITRVLHSPFRHSVRTVFGSLGDLSRTGAGKQFFDGFAQEGRSIQIKQKLNAKIVIGQHGKKEFLPSRNDVLENVNSLATRLCNSDQELFGMVTGLRGTGKSQLMMEVLNRWLEKGGGYGGIYIRFPSWEDSFQQELCYMMGLDRETTHLSAKELLDGLGYIGQSFVESTDGKFIVLIDQLESNKANLVEMVCQYIRDFSRSKGCSGLLITSDATDFLSLNNDRAGEERRERLTIPPPSIPVIREFIKTEYGIIGQLDEICEIIETDFKPSFISVGKLIEMCALKGEINMEKVQQVIETEKQIIETTILSICKEFGDKDENIKILKSFVTQYGGDAFRAGDWQSEGVFSTPQTLGNTLLKHNYIIYIAETKRFQFVSPIVRKAILSI